MTNAVEIEEAVEEFQKARYADQNGDVESKVKEQYRDYEAEARSTVKEFYRLNHANQSFDFVQQKKAQYLSLNRKTMSVWEAMEFLNNLVDDSDPDTDLTQIEHLMQTAEAIRADGHPRWFILTGLIHDLAWIIHVQVKWSTLCIFSVLF